MLRPALTGALAAACALAVPTAAPAFTLGVGDRADAPAAPSAALGARVYRVVIDPALPLATYDARIYAHRRAGQEPQLVVGGTGTTNHASTRGVVRAAVAAAQRWPFAYSVGVVNEPDLSGVGVCEYGRTYLEGRRALRAAGIRLVPFGEWSPLGGLRWHAATLNPRRCPNTAPRLRRVVTDVAWHGYDQALAWGPALRALTPRSVRLYMTEAGATLNTGSYTLTRGEADLYGLHYWRRVLRVAKRDRLTELVAWDIHSPPAHSAWDSSLLEPNGRARPAFHLIRRAAAR